MAIILSQFKIINYYRVLERLLKQWKVSCKIDSVARVYISSQQTRTSLFLTSQANWLETEEVL
jgi:hypothetical protein